MIFCSIIKKVLDHQNKARKPKNIYKEGIEQKSLLDGSPRYIYKYIYIVWIYIYIVWIYTYITLHRFIHKSASGQFFGMIPPNNLLLSRTCLGIRICV